MESNSTRFGFLNAVGAKLKKMNDKVNRIIDNFNNEKLYMMDYVHILEQYIDLFYVSILSIQFALGFFWLYSGQANADELSAEQPTAIGPGPTSTIEGTDLEESIRTPVPMEAPAPFAPGQGTTVEGINFNEDAVNNGGTAHIPPDPMGAAGPDHLVSVVNTSIEWHTKAGAQQNSQSLH